MKRVESLDFIRGIMAFIIMVYHYSYFGGWNNLEPVYFINKLGYYGVTIFFVLSGMSLTLAYKKFNFFSLRNLIIFINKRFTRILPLFWLVLSLYLIYFCLTETNFPSVKEVIYAYSLLFGFVNPMPYFITGGWSIGVEMVLYFFFPIVFLFLQKSQLKILLWIILFILFWYTTFNLLDSNSTVAGQWKKYINPINHLCYFVFGIIIAKSYNKYKNSTYGFLLLLSIVIFVFYPVEKDIELVYGIDKVLFTVLVVVFMYSNFHYKILIPEILKRYLKVLGDMSYGLYLLHPIVLKFVLFVLTGSILLQNYKLFVYVLSAFASLTISFVVFYFFEKPIMLKLRKTKGAE